MKKEFHYVVTYVLKSAKCKFFKANACYKEYRSI